MKNNCAFCNYKDKEVIIYGDKLCYTIISHQPINKYHVLVIPYMHYSNFVDLPDSLAAHLFVIAKKLSKAVRKACNPDAIEHISDDDINKIGINLMEHYKIHIIPRFKNDKVIIKWNREKDPGLRKCVELANDIKKNLK